MQARKLPNGNLLVPMRAVSADGNLLGDGMVEIGPSNPEYKNWLKDAERPNPEPVAKVPPPPRS